MGLSPAETLAMPLHDYQAALFHFAKTQGGDEEAEALAEGEYENMIDAIASAGLH